MAEVNVGEEVPIFNAFCLHNGMEQELVEQDRCVFRMEVQPYHMNYYGNLHGGVYFAMADSAAGFAARTDGRQYVTQQADLHFIRGENKGVIRADARVRYRGRATALVSVEISNDAGKLLATGEFTFFCISNRT